MYFPPIDRALERLGIRVRFGVVDGKASCEIGRQSIKKEELAFFESESDGLDRAKEWLGEVDICNISGTLHYIINWREAMTEIVKVSYPKLVVISRVPTPTSAKREGYVIQNVSTKYGYCGEVGVVLIPSIVLIEMLAKLGYTLVFDQGLCGDANWYWEEGCSSSEYKEITNKSFVFVKNSYALELYK